MSTLKHREKMVENFVLNKNQNIHYRGVRQPGLLTYAGGGLSHILPK